MHQQQLPTVSVLMPAYNYGQYVARALDSVLAQDYPAELMQIVVVDDGSTDDTAAVVEQVAARDPGRITLVRQPNSGPSAAINRALREAVGELVAVLDADDIWLPQKTRSQAQLLAADGSLGLVFCDMRVVDGSEQLVRPSQVGQIGAFPRRAFGVLLGQNVVTQSSLMIRRELTEQIPAGVPYSDWWFALCAARRSELHYIAEPLALYREHGSNLTSSVSGASGVREHLKEVSFQLWALRNLDLSGLTPQEVAFVWSGVERHASGVLASAGTLFVQLAEVDEDQRRQAQQLAAEALQSAEHGDFQRECVLLLSSLGWDPLEPDVQQRLRVALQRATAQQG